jgi:hypothetical protein
MMKYLLQSAALTGAGISEALAALKSPHSELMMKYAAVDRHWNL